jgi:hypothetical protein
MRQAGNHLEEKTILMTITTLNKIIARSKPSLSVAQLPEGFIGDIKKYQALMDKRVHVDGVVVSVKDFDKLCEAVKDSIS